MMNAHNLAIVFGPNIIRSNSPNPFLALQDNGSLTYATELLISHYEQVFAGVNDSPNTQSGSSFRRPQALKSVDLEQLKNLNFDDE